MKRRLLCFAAFALAIPIIAQAQTTGTLEGKVVDEGGAALEKALIRIKGTDRGGYSGTDGKFRIVGVRAGQIEVLISYAGREAINQTASVTVNQTTSLGTVKLVKKGAGTVVEIVAPKGRRADVPGSVDTKTGDQINRSSRTGNVFQTAVLSTGVSSVGQNGLGFRGGRAEDGSIRVDGQEISDPFEGSVGSSSLGLYPTVSTLAIEQVQTITSGFGPEYGDVLSGVFNSITRSGRNDRYEGQFRFTTGVPALYGSADPITVKKAGTDIDTTLPGATLAGSGSKTYEFAFGGPIPGLDILTFFITGKYAHSPFGGGYEIYDMTEQFAASRAAAAKQAWGFSLSPTNLAELPHDEVMVRNLQGKFKLDVSPEIKIELGGEIGLTSSEAGGWSQLYLYDHPTFYTRNDLGEITDSTVDLTLLERDMQQTNQNTIIQRAQVKYQHFLDNSSFFDVTASFTHHLNEIGKKDESKEYGIFDTYDIYPVTDANNDRVVDRYAIPEQQLRLNPFLPDPIASYGRNPITGLYEGGQVSGASRNPFAIQDGNFPVHGNGGLETREATELRLKGNYETNFDIGDVKTQLKAGFELAQTTLRRNSNNLPWDGNPFFDVYGYESTYFDSDTTGTLKAFFLEPYKPLEGALYVGTRFDYNSIIFQGGVRFDFISPNTFKPPVERTGLEQIIKDIQASGDASMKFQVSPRVGVSYPITEESFFRVNFAVMFKMPEYNVLYDNAYNDAQRGNQLFGNPDIEPQKAYIYELGYSTRIAEEFSFDVSAYYRDIYNQTGITYVPAIPNPYILYTVTEYGNVRGFELSARRNLKDNFEASINYTLQKAVGTSSSPTGNYSTVIGSIDPYTNKPQQLPLTEYPLNYDQTHSLNATIAAVWGDGEGPSIGGLKLLENTVISLTGFYGTGLPYTRENQKGEQITEYNSLRLPSSYATEMHIERGFKMRDFFGDGVGQLELTFFADIRNLLNNTEAVSVRFSSTRGGSRYTITGSPDNDGQALNRQRGDFQAISHYRDVVAGNPDTWAQGQYDDFGVRRYNPYADGNLDGVVTQLERYESYQRFVAVAQQLRPAYNSPRTVTVGVKLRF